LSAGASRRRVHLLRARSALRVCVNLALWSGEGRGERRARGVGAGHRWGDWCGVVCGTRCPVRCQAGGEAASETTRGGGSPGIGDLRRFFCREYEQEPARQDLSSRHQVHKSPDEQLLVQRVGRGVRPGSGTPRHTSPPLSYVTGRRLPPAPAIPARITRRLCGQSQVQPGQSQVQPRESTLKRSRHLAVRPRPQTGRPLRRRMRQSCEVRTWDEA
jgi:hypothetical protein